ncbi:MAG: efflux RND transporter periplasmic adaptor subunit [Desulfobulbaceae bacterium]|nr:MAG: efflux RND transporter periplasmic adaptor subunit [Desulfobulbaceae bacterium]
MKRITIFVLVAGLIGVGLYVWHIDRTGQVADERQISCNSTTVDRGTLSNSINGRGKLAAKRLTNIRSDGGAGRLSSVRVSDGDTVSEGQCLAEVTLDTGYHLELQNTRWERSRNSQLITQIEKQLVDQKKLVEEGFASEMSIKEAERQLSQAQAQKKILESKIAFFEEKFGWSDDDSKEVCIKAPFPGTVLEVYKKPGDGIGPAEFPMGGGDGTIMVLADMSELFVDYNVSEVYLENVLVGQSVEIRFDAFSKKTYIGEIEKISRVPLAANSQGQMFGDKRDLSRYPTKIRLIDPTSELRPGLSGRITITLEQVQDVVMVPVSALIRDGEEEAVLLVEQGDVIRRQVETGMISDNFAEVKSGLQQGEEVCIEPFVVLENQMLKEESKNRNIFERIFE